VLAHLKQKKLAFVSEKARQETTSWLAGIMDRAGLMHGKKFVEKDEFKKAGYLGSGGIGRFRNRLWAAAFKSTKLGNVTNDDVAALAARCTRRCE
jgi:hypothetical protein